MAVYRRGDVWYLDYYQQGRRVRVRIGESKSLAKEALHKRKAGIAEGRHFPSRAGKAILFEEAARLYWELYAKHKRGPANPKGRRCAIFYLSEIVKSFSGKKIGEIQTADILAYVSQLREGRSPATYNRYLVIIKSIFNRAVEWGWIASNPASKIKKLAEDNKQLRFLEKDEITVLIKAASPKLRPVLFCAILTGMRRGEITNLKWGAVDMERDILYVNESKSGKPRQIPIVPQLREFLLALDPGAAEEPVFKIADVTIKRHFAKALQAAGIRDFRFHDLRHTFASHFIMKTCDLPALQKLLGHATPQMTQRYAHLANSHLKINMVTFASGLVTNWSQNRFPAEQAGQKVSQNLLENREFSTNGPIV